MAKPVSVLYVSTEVNPFAKTGSLADVANSLPLSLFNSGVEVRVAMPKYGFISERRSRLHEVIRLKDIEVSLNGENKLINVRVGVLPDTRVQVYFIDNEEFFKRDSLYTDPRTQEDFEDNHKRFAFFSKSIFEMLKRLGWQPNIIHCNEWHTGLIPYFLKTYYANDEFFANTKTLFTIHNIAQQGTFDPSIAPDIDILENHVNSDGLMLNGKLNFMRAAIQYADQVNTVSDFYAKQTLESDEISDGLNKDLKVKEKTYTGIVNGIDYKVWNPEDDKLIPANFSNDHLIGKMECKKAIVEKLGLPFSEETPVIGMVTRMVESKGIDMMIEAIAELLNRDVQIIFMGHGEEKYQKNIESLKTKFPGKVGIIFSYDDKSSHLVYAGSDLYLMPSRFETCGTGHFYAMKYGTIPVVFETGALADSIIDATDNSLKNATGFKFTEYKIENFMDAINRALEMFNDKPKWKMLITNVMAKNYSWDMVAEKYHSIYKKIVKDK